MSDSSSRLSLSALLATLTMRSLKKFQRMQMAQKTKKKNAWKAVVKSFKTSIDDTASVASSFWALLRR